MYNEIQERIKTVIASQFPEETINKDEIDFESDLNELGLDSASFIAFVVSLEAEFNVEFQMEDLNMGKFATLRDVGEFIQAKLQD